MLNSMLCLYWSQYRKLTLSLVLRSVIVITRFVSKLTSLGFADAVLLLSLHLFMEFWSAVIFLLWIYIWWMIDFSIAAGGWIIHGFCNCTIIQYRFPNIFFLGLIGVEDWGLFPPGGVDNFFQSLWFSLSTGSFAAPNKCFDFVLFGWWYWVFLFNFLKLLIFFGVVSLFSISVLRTLCALARCIFESFTLLKLNVHFGQLVFILARFLLAIPTASFTAEIFKLRSDSGFWFADEIGFRMSLRAAGERKLVLLLFNVILDDFCDSSVGVGTEEETVSIFVSGLSEIPLLTAFELFPLQVGIMVFF